MVIAQFSITELPDGEYEISAYLLEDKKSTQKERELGQSVLDTVEGILRIIKENNAEARK